MTNNNDIEITHDEVVRPKKKDTSPADGAGATTTTTQVVEGTREWVIVARGFAYVELSSMVLMFACIGEWNGSAEIAYAISVAVISLAACLIMQTGEFVKPGTLDMLEKPVSLFLLVWWAVGVGVITFKAPFTVTSNGYFSAWAGLIFTTKWALKIDTTPITEMEYGRKLILILGICGALEVFSTIAPISSKYSVGRAAWGMAAGCITIIACAFLFKVYDDTKVVILKVTAALFCCIWILVVGLLTFGGPFVLTGNGYFASWAGFIVSMMFGLHLLEREDDMV